MMVPLWVVALFVIFGASIGFYVVPRFSVGWYLRTLPLRNALYVVTAPLRRWCDTLLGWFDGLGVIDEIACDCGRLSMRRVVSMEDGDELAARRSLCALCDLCGQSEPRPPSRGCLSEPPAQAGGTSEPRPQATG